MAIRNDDPSKPKLGPPRSKGPTKAPKFIGRVFQAGYKSGKGIGRGRPSAGKSSRPGPRSGRGHTVAKLAAGRLGPRSRWAIVKARIVRMDPASAKRIAANLRYIQRDAVTPDGGRGEMYSARSDSVDDREFQERGQGDRHQFRFIVSAEDATELGELKSYTRELMHRVERDLGTDLDWVAVDHWDTDNPHTHIVVRGRVRGRDDLVISSDYISQGMRMRASELATEWLGERTDREIRESLDRQVTQERWTPIDQKIRDLTLDGVIDLRAVPDALDARSDRSQALGRLRHLNTTGLATETSPLVWQLSADIEPTLREMGRRGDIIRTMQKSLGTLQREYAISVAEHMTPITGRVAGKGLADELTDRGFLIVDGVDDRAHYVALAAHANLEDYSTGSVVTVRADSAGTADAHIARIARDGVYRADQHVRIATETERSP